jgi:hypothetical protein
MAPVHCSNGGIPDTLRQYIVLLGSPNESAAITRFDEVSLKCCEMSVTNRTGSANAKYNGFVIIGKKLRVGQVIFLQARCEGPVAGDIKPDRVAVASMACRLNVSS